MRSSLLVVLAALAAFAGSLGAAFAFDDHALFAGPYAWRTRPLTWATFWLNRQLSPEPWSWHAANLLLHVLASWLVWKALSRLLPERAALLGAVLFAVHPIQSEAVTYVFARAIVLATVLCLLTLLCWMDGRPWLAAACFALALLAKEEAAAFPLFLALLPKRDGRALAAMLALSLAAGVNVILAAGAGSGAGGGSGLAWWQYFEAQGPVILRYARLLVVPYGFTVDPDIAMPGALVAVVCWTVIGGAALYCLRRGWIWVPAALLLLLPSSSVFPASDLAADRRLYLPMVAISAGAGLVLSRLRPAFPVALLAVLIPVSESRTAVWWTEERLWTEAVERAPRKLRPKLQLARVLPLDRAEPLLREAEREAPEDARIPAELGRAYLEANRPADALTAFGRALALDPNNPWNHNNRGVALAALGQIDAAGQDFEAALKLNPGFAEARSNLEKLRRP